MKKTLYIDLDGVLADFDRGVQEAVERDPGIDPKRAYRVPDFFRDLELMPGAKDAVDRLMKKYDCYILSTVPWSVMPLASHDKVLWVKARFGDAFKKRIIFTHRKDLCIGDYLIDDRPDNGAAQFKGEWIHFGSNEFPDWNSVLSYLGA